MKKLLAVLLLLGAFLVPDAAYATYSCFGTRSPCDLTGGIKVSKLDKPAKVKKGKKVKKSKKPVKHKKVAKKKAAPAKTYCYPEPRVKAGSLPDDLPKQTMIPKDKKEAKPAAEKAPEVKAVPEAMPAPEPTPAPEAKPAPTDLPPINLPGANP